MIEFGRVLQFARVKLLAAVWYSYTGYCSC